jgi:hypothetical protein
MSYEVFISYSSKDKNIANAICNHLENSGVACWIAPRDIVPGTEWATAIIDGISACKILLLLFTENSDRSPQVLREVERAISKGLIVIPLRLENLMPTKSMEYYLSAVHWLDAFIPPHEKYFDVITNRIKSIIAGESLNISNLSGRAKSIKPYSSGRYLSGGEISLNKNKSILVASIIPHVPFVLLEQEEQNIVMVGKSQEEIGWQYEATNMSVSSGAAKISYMMMTESLFKFNSSLEFRNAAIKRDFGQYAHHADFLDIKRFSSIVGAAQIIDLLGLRGVTNPEIGAYDGVDYWNQGPFVTYNGAVSEGSRAYFICVHDGILMDDWRVIDTIDNNSIDLGSWHNNRPILFIYEKECEIAVSDHIIKVIN